MKSIKSMEYYVQPNDWLVIGVSLLLLLALVTYIYYVMQDREDAPVSKEELGYVILTNILTGLGMGGVIYGIMLMRLHVLYPPVDGVDMGEPPF